MKWIFVAILSWLPFVLSLAGWWFYFGISNLPPETPELLSQRHHRMLFMEGCVLMISLLCGGLALFYFAYRTNKEKEAKEVFFASFTHDLKTSLFRLQLEVEKLSSRMGEQELAPLFGQTRKMTLDLENSLDSTFGYGKKIFLEKINLNDFLTELRTQWPELSLRFSGEREFFADRRALHSIFNNLLHNSYVHGEADEVEVQLYKRGSDFAVNYQDNGKSFTGDLQELGVLSQTPKAGSGFGLFIVRQWVQLMGGKVS
ncbi:MAG: HAMP domain-containing sensor histidine kinase, partial [Pseudomonadota bacterium]